MQSAVAVPQSMTGQKMGCVGSSLTVLPLSRRASEGKKKKKAKCALRKLPATSGRIDVTLCVLAVSDWGS